MNDEATEPQSKTYWVTGAAAVLGHQPGDSFEAALDPAQETFYLEGGHLSETEPVPEEGVTTEVDGDAPPVQNRKTKTAPPGDAETTSPEGKE